MISLGIVKSEKCEEYIMLDMQGQLEHNQPSLNTIPLGQLQQVSDQEYKLMIGIHDIIGKKQKIDPPFAITKTILIKDPITALEYKQIQVIGICKFKLIFNQRPTPVMERLNKKVVLDK